MENIKIINGLNGSYYLIEKGKLLKIIKVEYSEDYPTGMGSYVEYTLEDGRKIKVQ